MEADSSSVGRGIHSTSNETTRYISQTLKRDGQRGVSTVLPELCINQQHVHTCVSISMHVSPRISKTVTAMGAAGSTTRTT